MLGPEDFEAKDIQMQQEIPEAMAKEAEMPAQSQSYGDFIFKYAEGTAGVIDENNPDMKMYVVDQLYVVLYVPLEQIQPLEISSYSYNSIPKCYTYMDLEGLNASGVDRLHNHPYLMLRGRQTAVAVIDSGIDYRHPAFLDRSGKTRIWYLWDQTIPGKGEGVPYGRLYTKEDIDRALESEDPLEVVPSMDENGHGTALAGIAAGNFVQEEGFSGAAPEAELIVVKLKKAKNYLREFYLYPADAEIFQENDIMLGISMAFGWARKAGKPLSICLGLGTSQGAHIGKSPLSQYIDYVMGISRISVSEAAGNEGAARHHFRGTIRAGETERVAELRVGERENGFTMELWGEPPEILEAEIQSPTGERLQVSSSLGTGTQTLSFVFVETKVLVNYIAIERATGNPLIYLRFFHPAAGIWKIRVRIQNEKEAGFHIWLPVQGLISPDTYFLESSPYNTVTSPGDSQGGITVTAYNYRDGSLYLEASRGFMPNGDIAPELAAPGVAVRVPLAGGGFGSASGTSLGTAQTAGIVALLFEWALIRGNEPYFTGTSAKYYLQRGALRDPDMQYPNPDWGYGKIDLYHTFEILS